MFARRAFAPLTGLVADLLTFAEGLEALTGNAFGMNKEVRGAIRAGTFEALRKRVREISIR